MTTQTTTLPSTKSCPYCGKPYREVTIPAFMGIPERTILAIECGCEGELAAKAAEARKEKLNKRTDTMRKVGIPKRYWEIPQDTTYLKAIDNGGLFIHGLVGRGKTWLAVATTKAWLNAHKSRRVVFTDATALLAHVRKAYDGGETEAGAIWRYSGADLLIYDDFGKGRQSEWAMERIESIVQYRYENELPTIFTSQWAGADLIRRLSEGSTEESATAIVSRIVQTCQMVELTGPDRRMQPIGA